VLDFRLILILEYAFTGRRISARLKKVTLAVVFPSSKTNLSLKKTNPGMLAGGHIIGLEAIS
jgi:hypothetical protein